MSFFKRALLPTREEKPSAKDEESFPIKFESCRMIHDDDILRASLGATNLSDEADASSLQQSDQRQQEENDNLEMASVDLLKNLMEQMEQMWSRHYEMEQKLQRQIEDLQIQNEDFEQKMQCQQMELEQMKQRVSVNDFNTCSIQKRTKKKPGDASNVSPNKPSTVISPAHDVD